MTASISDSFDWGFLLDYAPEDLPLLNRLARIMYALRGYIVPEGYDFTKATHPHEQEAFSQACAALAFIRDEEY